MPDKSGAFLRASRIIRENHGNITRVSYNNTVDAHTLFIEVAADEEQHERIAQGLRGIGYLPDTPAARSILIVLTLPDEVGAVEPVLEILCGFNVNISYMSSQENGTLFQYFKMGLLIENPDEIKRLLDRLSSVCAVNILDYDVTEKPLDNTVFYLSFAADVRAMLSLSQEDTNSLIINSNRVMQILDERGELPFKTFDYIKRFASFLSSHHGDEFRPRISATREGEFTLHLIEPPCGSNTYILERGGDLLFIDCGFACYRDEMLAVFRSLFSDFDNRRKLLVITHADIDHTGLLDLFDVVYMNKSCYDNFVAEQRGEPNFREQNRLHSPYCTLSKIISGYRPPRLGNAVIVGEKKSDAVFEDIGGFDFEGLWFELIEGYGGHVRGENLIVCEALGLVFTGDIYVNAEGFTDEQREFNTLAPYLMTSVNVDSAKAREERRQLYANYAGYRLMPAHGRSE